MLFILFPQGSLQPAVPDASDILDVPDLLAYLESGGNGNNAPDTTGELSASDNLQTSGPDAVLVAGQAPSRTTNRQNSKPGWVYGGGNDHIKLAADGAQTDFDLGGCYIAIVAKITGDSGSWGNLYPRLWALDDKVYLNTIAGSSASAHKLSCYRRYSSTDDWRTSSNDVLTTNNAAIIEYIRNGSSPTQEPSIRVNGASIPLTLSAGPGAGTPDATAGKVFHIGNRESNDNDTFFLDRPFPGDIYAFVAVGSIPTLTDQKTILDELAASWSISVANPFNPSIENQAFTITENSAAGTSITTPVASGPIGQTLTWSMTGDLTTYYSIDTATGLISVKTGATAPAAGTDTTGTVTVDNGVGTDNATVTISTVVASSLKYTRPPWIVAASRTVTASSSSGVQPFSPNTDGEDIEILAPSNTSISAGGWRAQASGGNKFRNVAIIGGHYVGTHDAGAGGSNSTDWVWRVQDITGDIWFEGVRFTPFDRQDGVTLAPNNTSTKAYFQRCWWDRVNGPRDSPHGDWIQTRHKIGDIYIDNWFGKSGYQGFFFDGRPGSDNHNAEIHGTVVITNGDGVRVDNVRSDGWPYGECDPSQGGCRQGGGTDATGGFIFYLDPYPGGYRIGDANSRSTDAVWIQKYSGIYVGSDSPTTPPNRLIRPGSGSQAVFTSSGGDEYLTLSTGEGFINIGNRVGGPLLAEGPDVGRNFVAGGSSTVIGGMGYS